MQFQPKVSRITIYPIKSLDGMDLQKAMITDGGCLLHDREFAIQDEKGNYVNGKSTPLVHHLRSKFDLEKETISIRPQKEVTWQNFHLHAERLKLESYLSAYFGIPVVLIQSTTGRFIDVPDLAGVTVISASSLQTVSSWFNNLDIEQSRNRFRANIELEDVPAFWEDQLFLKNGMGVEFKIGDVTVFGLSPCGRCVVPSRNPINGEVYQGFQKQFSKQRESLLTKNSSLKNYGHRYYLSVNCYIPETEIGKWIEVGNEVIIIGEKVFLT